MRINDEVIKNVMNAISNRRHSEEEIDEKAKVFSLCLDITQEDVKQVLLDLHYKNEAS
jgi:hypothetical protein